MRDEMYLPTIIKVISHQLSDLGARAIVVGGSVRDHFLALPIKDYDVEVYGLSNLNHLISILEKYGSVNLVGKSFGVLKFTHDGEEYRLAQVVGEMKELLPPGARKKVEVNILRYIDQEGTGDE